MNQMKLRIAMSVSALVVALAACGGGGGSSANPSAGASAGASQGASSAGAGGAVTLAAKDIKFSTDTLSAPADEAFTLRFDNQEAIPHNVSISDSSGAKAFTGEVFAGPGSRDYPVPPLAAGSYTFICDVHPEMRGTLDAG